MKKFYFLNRNKQWRGPYRYPQILFFCLNGTIKPTTYLWHNRLATDIGKHPSKSIYARKNAHEFRALPKWVFGSNLNIIARNNIKNWKKCWQKKNDWASFVAKPIETPTILENAIKIYLMPSITAIHDFAAPGNFKVKLIYLDRDDDKKVKVSEYPIQLFNDDNPGIKFEITMAQPPMVGGVEYKESYGLHRQLQLICENEGIVIAKNGVFDFSTRYPYQPQILKGRFRQANLVATNSYKNCYNRLILKVDDDKMIGPQNIIAHTGKHLYDHEKFNVHASLMGISFKTGGSFTEVLISGIPYNFYEVEGNILIIDGADKEDLTIFKQKVEIIRIALALMSGKFYGGPCNYVSSEDPDFKQVDGVWYELEKESVLSTRRTIDLQFFRSIFKETDEDYAEKYKTVNGPVSTALFSALCEALWTNEDLLHAANLVISGMGNSDPLQQGALYSVALETLTENLTQVKSKELKPIPEKELSKAFIADLKIVLSGYADKISEEGLIILGKNIDGVNRPTNRDKLVKTFELYGISLSDEDKETIDKRNDYLHGRNPLDLQHIFELTQISLRLHTLIVALMLKSVGYSGHIVNLDNYIYLTDEKRLLKLIEEEQGIYNKLIDQIQQVVQAQDEATLNKSKVELDKILENNKLTDMIKII